MTQITADRVRAAFDYDPETGLFLHKRSVSSVKAGAIAGSVGPSGYVKVGIDGVMIYGHRLAWVHFYGVWPDGDVDHINRNRSDNRIANLRAVTRSENSHNRNLNRNNTSGFRGVRVTRKRFVAEIRIKQQKIHLGSFATAEEAFAAHESARLAAFPILAEGT